MLCHCRRQAFILACSLVSYPHSLFCFKLDFTCNHTWEDGSVETWRGKIVSVKNYGQYCEINIVSRSSLHLIFGKYSQGLFVCSPFYGGTYLSSHLGDIYYNTERLSKVFDNVVDGITAAKALATIAQQFDFE